MFYLFGASIAFFLVLLILIKKDKTNGDYILLLWMSFIGVHISLFYLEHTGTIFDYPWLIGVSLPLPILHGSLLYFYTVRTTRQKFLTVFAVTACLTPFVILTLSAIPFYQISAAEKITVYQNKGAGFEWYLLMQNIMIPSFGLLFSVLSIREIRKYRERLLNNFSNSDRKMLRWLEYLSIGLAVIWLLVVFFSDSVIFGGVVVFVLLIGLFGINQIPVFSVQPAIPEQPAPGSGNPIASPDVDKYLKTGLKDDDAIRLKGALDQYMEQECPYKNANLTLDDLANGMKIQPNQLSQIINSIEGKNFYHYINTYRIREFLNTAALPESRKFTYLGLAYDCGFNSKTTFNKYFKLHTGKTPSEYFETENERTLVS